MLVVSQQVQPSTRCEKKKILPLFLVFSLCLLVSDNIAFAQTASNTAPDSANQSSRERDRILLKRSPIASEYQLLTAPGEVLGASFDAEGVDFRAQFRLQKGKSKASSVKVEGNYNYQSIAETFELGGSINAAKSFGKLSLQLQVQQNNSDRLVDFYASRWLSNYDPDSSDTEILTLGYPRYTQDGLQTKNINTRWRADYQLSNTMLLSYEGVNTNYDDIANRNRFETQFGAGELYDTVLSHDGSTIEEAAVSSAKIRRYFHRLDTKRDINRHKLSFTIDKESDFIEVSTYYSRWVNDRLWLPWNFIDNGISATYNLHDRYLPNVTITNADIYDLSNSVFANYRIADTVTTDTDYALLFEWDKKITIANNDLWIKMGGAWRNKERSVDNSRAVYRSTSSAFSLADIADNTNDVNIMNDNYLLPAGLGVENGDAYFIQNKNEQFALNLQQSFLETIQDIYTSEETVSSLYLNAYQQRKNWFWRSGLRLEKTKTTTRGAVYDSPDSNIGVIGEAITSVAINGETIEETFASFDAAFVEGGNSYQHILPSLELRFNVNEKLTIKTAYYQQLMRPQYFDTVSYRRTNVATLSITEGNPSLEATTIQNLYAGLEYKYSSKGQLFAGVYYNTVSDFFYDSNTTELINNELYEVARVENGKDGFIKGIQTYWSERFRLASFGDATIKFAYTYSNSEATLTNRKITMPERAAHRASMSLLLSDTAWQYRSQFSWQSEALDDVGASAMQDTIREDVLVWNQSLTWHFDKNILARFSVNNILDSPERSYQGQSSRVINNSYSGSTMRLSVALAY